VLAVLPAVLIVAALVALVYKVDHAYTPALRRVPLALHWGTLLLASAVWLSGYTQLVQLWGASLAWWGSPPLRWRPALRVFCVSNLARYIPGAVWQFAGLAALASAEGVSPAAASVGVLLEQVVLLATGLALVLSVAPSFLANWTHGLGVGAQLAIAVLLIAALVIGLPRALPRVRTWAERVVKRPLPLPAIPQGPFAVYVIRGALSWVIYGVAFWLFARALMGPAAPGVWLSATAYVASYLVGLLAVVAPGGIIVREGALVLCLTSTIGAQPALILAVMSRLWLIALEVLAALVVLSADAIRQRLRIRMTN
jgi:hypothetical protein